MGPRAVHARLPTLDIIALQPLSRQDHLANVKLQAEEQQFKLRTQIKELENYVHRLEGQCNDYEDEVRRLKETLI